MRAHGAFLMCNKYRAMQSELNALGETDVVVSGWKYEKPLMSALMAVIKYLYKY